MTRKVTDMLPDNTYNRTTGIVLREELDNWALLFNPENGKVAGINAVGVVMWKLLQDHHTIRELIQAIENIFDEIPTNVENDVTEFLTNLSNRGFITVDLHE